MNARTIEAEFPKKLIDPLFKKSRFKCLRGGRGSAKSWSVARALLIQAGEKPLRVLCTRETQKSIRDSVHKLLSDQIQLLGFEEFYEVQQVQIRGRNGSEFVFAGLSDQTAESIKSFEGADRVWVEEAQVVSHRSWTILIPTIRKPGSEIWVTFNPELDNDPTWQRFIEHPPQDCVSVEINWNDNPWFSDEMKATRIHDSLTLPKWEYDNIWEGKCRPAVSGAIYAEEVAQLFADGRVGDFPYDSFAPVYAIWDLGWNDKMAIIIAQRHISQLRVIDYIEDDHKTLDWYSRELRQRPYTISELFLPHDGGHADYRTGQSAQRILQDLGWRVNVLKNAQVDEGIRAARMAFKSLYVNRSKCERLLDCLKRYRRAIPVNTGEPGSPLHNEHSHGADAYRYLCMAAPEMGSQAEGGGLKLPPLNWKWKTA